MSLPCRNDSLTRNRRPGATDDVPSDGNRHPNRDAHRSFDLTEATREPTLVLVRRAWLALAVLALIAGVFGLGYLVGTHANDTRVPNLLGLGTRDGGQAAARRELAPVALRLGQVRWKACASDERGLVVEQNPSAGTVLPRDATVNIVIGGTGIGIFAGGPPQCLPGKQQPAGQPPS